MHTTEKRSCDVKMENLMGNSKKYISQSNSVIMYSICVKIKNSVNADTILSNPTLPNVFMFIYDNHRENVLI